MSEFPVDLKYTHTHEWVQLMNDGTVAIGLTDFAQMSLGDIVFVELPEPNTVLMAGDEACVIESVKAASECYAPISGTIEKVNEALADAPETINSDCYVEGWLFHLRPDDLKEMDALLDAATYQASCDQDD